MQYCLTGLLCAALTHCALAGEPLKAIRLRPPRDFAETHRKARANMPFFMAVPLAKGEAKALPKTPVLKCAGRPVPATVRPAAYWPDGSVQWLRVDGVWPAGMDVASTASVEAGAPTASGRAPSVVRRGSGLAILDGAGRVMARLAPEAKALRITRPKAPTSAKLEDLETKTQYAWAEDVSALNPTETPRPLALRVRKVVRETANPVYSVYRVRGDGGLAEPGRLLEWQLRVRTYAAAPVVRFQMTWLLHWDPKQYALASAKWVATFDAPFDNARCAAVGRPLPIADAPTLSADVTGRVRVTLKGRRAFAFDRPDLKQGAWALGRGDKWLAVALPNFTRLGPNHLRVGPKRIEVACWSGESGKALDCRRTARPDEFGMSKSDFKVDARGLARTIPMTWTWADSRESAEALALSAARRDHLWFTGRDELVRTRALGPWRPGAYERNSAFLNALVSQVNWVMASRDHLRWNGFINFGDIRTNFGSRDILERGVYRMRWSYGGRYGWRHGSGEPYLGFLILGLYVEDRPTVLDALDYGAHVADVDLVHGRFGRPLRRYQGGMHRRNKDHWSGKVQMQYTPCRGLYLLSWLTGQERFAEALAEICDLAARAPGGSVYAPTAWMLRYCETHDPADGAKAEALLAKVSAMWRLAVRAKPQYKALDDLAVLYAGNFRLTLDGFPMLIELHRATGDPKYLNAMLASVRAHPEKRVTALDLTQHYVLTYLLANGLSEEQIGKKMVDDFRKVFANWRYSGKTIPREQWGYESLIANRRQTYHTAGLGLRAMVAPLVVSHFPSGDGALPAKPSPAR